MSDKLYILHKGTIKFGGSTLKLRGKSDGNFVMRFSRKSKMSQKDIERLLASDQVEMRLREVTISEFVYVFDCQNDTMQKAAMLVLDKVMDKAKSGKLVMNELSMNTLDDVICSGLLVKEDGPSTLKNDKTTVSLDKKTKELTTDGIKVKQISSFKQFQVMSWKRFIIAIRSKWIFVFGMCYQFLTDMVPFFCASVLLGINRQYKLATDDLLREGHVSVNIAQNDTESILRSYCQLDEFQQGSRCRILNPGQSYHEWIYQQADTFHEYGQKFLYSYDVDKYNDTRYRVTVFQNEYSKHAKSFGMMHFFNHLVSQVNIEAVDQQHGAI